MIKRRKVFYVMGFDPRGTSFYHALLRRESRLSKRRGFSHWQAGTMQPAWLYGETCHAAPEGDTTIEHIDYEFMSITDLVTDYFRLPLLTRIIQFLRLAVYAFACGFMRNSYGRARYFTLFMFYPAGVLALVMLLSLLAGAGLGWWVGGLAGWLAFALTTPLVATLLIALIKRFEARFYIFYLIGDFLFSVRALMEPFEAFDSRLDQFADRVLEALRETGDEAADEVVMVGHSSGGLLAILLAERLVERCTPAERQRLALVTLGNQASLALFPKAAAFRCGIAKLINSPGLTWLDIFAPQDVISSGRFELPRELEIEQQPGSGYRFVSARLKEQVTEARYQRIRHAFLTLHMQYLRASETGQGFNYFSMLESPLRLRDQRI